MPQALIYRPSKTATQSGRALTKQWLLIYEVASPRTPDPLMGWSSAADTLNEVQLKFDTLEEAVAFAKKEGLDYTVIEPQEPRLRLRSYADNFRWQRPG
jgi:NADH dehydrogenase ubiquinone Fe-S protein 4